MKKILLFVSVAFAATMGFAQVSSIDDLVGTYNESYDYKAIWDDWATWQGGQYTNSVTITKIDDTTISIYNLSYQGETYEGKVDFAAGTITIQPHAGTYYTACALPENITYGAYEADKGDSTAPIVGKINADGSLSFDWAMLYGTTVVMTSKSVLNKVNMTKVWEETGTLDYLLDDAEQTKYRSITATLTKWEGGNYEYELTYGDPKYGYANPATIQFNVDKNLQIVLVNGYSNVAPSAWYYYPFSDCYDIKVYTSSYSGFDEEEKNLYMWYYWYDTYESKPNERQGYMDFNWGNATAINNVAATKAAPCVKRLTSRGIVVVKNGKTYDLLGKEVK